MERDAHQDDTREISLVNDLRQIAAVAGRIDDFCAGRDISPHVAYAVNLAIEELLTNTISYGYDDEDAHRIEIILRMEGDALVVVIVDDSMPFDPTREMEVDVASSIEDRRVGGLGLLLVRQMMDEVEYRRLEGCNIVTLTKSTAETEPTGEGGQE